uniref:Lens intrinsic membrane protein 2.1 n=1 Tax=Oreochromis niloticus TaxID=8128 RepID=A0A669B3V2_ORENI
MNSFMGGGLFCAGVENILLIVSTATDYWMQYRQSSNYMHQSLWRYCTPGNCFPHGESRCKRIISLLICVIGIISGVTAFIHYSSFDRFDKRFDIFSWLYIPGWASVVLTLISGIIYIYMHECPRSATSH